MNISKIRSIVIASVLGFAFASSAACSSSQEGASTNASALDTVSAIDDADVLDLGCPAPTTCEAEVPLPVAEDIAPADDMAPAPDLQEANTAYDSDAGYGILPRGNEIGDKTFYDKCVAGLKGAGSAAKKTIKVCTQTLVLCAALMGNKNGTEIQKFCAAASKVATCRTSAEDARRKIQDQICVACSNTVQCGDAGAPK